MHTTMHIVNMYIPQSYVSMHLDVHRILYCLSVLVKLVSNFHTQLSHLCAPSYHNFCAVIKGGGLLLRLTEFQTVYIPPQYNTTLHHTLTVITELVPRAGVYISCHSTCGAHCQLHCSVLPNILSSRADQEMRTQQTVSDSTQPSHVV